MRRDSIGEMISAEREQRRLLNKIQSVSSLGEQFGWEGCGSDSTASN